METSEFSPENVLLDQATATCLARLKTMPMDLSRLENTIDTQIPRLTKTQALSTSHWLRPFRALAAGLIVVATIAGILLSVAGQPVEASVAEMASFHNDLVAGRVPVTRVNSIADANKIIEAQWAKSPRMPSMPHDHVMACCMRSVKDRKMACVLLEGDGEPVSMTIAKSTDVKTPTSPVVMSHGIEFHVEAIGVLNMVMTQRKGRWICMMAKLPQTRLMDLAASLQF